MANKFRERHGDRYTRLYSIWAGMKSRCQNPNTKDYQRYGARGIKVCDKWQSFIGFKSDMGDSYKKHESLYGAKNTTIDRISASGDYELSNCRWATKQEQSINKTHGWPSFARDNFGRFAGLKKV